MDYNLKVMSIEDDYPHVRKIVVVRPSGFSFDPGKFVMVAVNKTGLETKRKKCAFFSLNNDFYIEIIINDSDLDSKPLFDLKAGEEIIMSDVVGELRYDKPGTFIAAGKGIFAALDVFKHLKKIGALPGNTLVYLARTPEEVYYERMFKHTFPNSCVVVIARDQNNNVKAIDEDLLRQKVPDLQKPLYVMGPKSFIENSLPALEKSGVVFQTDVAD